MHTTTTAIETKSANGPEVTAAFEEFMGAFEAFKDANDQRLGEIEKRGVDAVTHDKVERINAALDSQKSLIDELVLKARRPGIGGRADLVSDIALASMRLRPEASPWRT